MWLSANLDGPRIRAVDGIEQSPDTDVREGDVAFGIGRSGERRFPNAQGHVAPTKRFAVGDKTQVQGGTTCLPALLRA